jgi:hypothetical protein
VQINIVVYSDIVVYEKFNYVAYRVHFVFNVDISVGVIMAVVMPLMCAVGIGIGIKARPVKVAYPNFVWQIYDFNLSINFSLRNQNFP